MFQCGSNQSSKAALSLVKKGGTTVNFNTAGKASFTSGINGNVSTSLVHDDPKIIHPKAGTFCKGTQGKANGHSAEVSLSNPNRSY